MVVVSGPGGVTCGFVPVIATGLGVDRSLRSLGLVFCTQLGRAPILGAARLTVGGGGVWAWWRDLRVCFGHWDWAGCGPVFRVLRTGFLHPIGACAHIGCSQADCGWWWRLGLVA